MKHANARVLNFAKLMAAIGALVVAFLAYQSVGAAADQSELVPVEQAGGNAVPGSYLVFYKDGTSGQVRNDAADLGLRSLSGRGLGYSAALNDNQLAQLRRDPNVDSIAEDFYVRIPDVPSAPVNGSGTPTPPPVSWGLDRIDQRAADTNGSFSPNGNGQGVRIYVMDGGVNPNHPELSGRVVGGTSFVGGDPLDDCTGHGTAVASAAAGQTVGVANNASIYSLKVGGCGEYLEFSAIMTALDWVSENNTGPAILNLSFGDDRAIPNPLTTNHVFFHYIEAVERVSKAGVTVVAASGNDGAPSCSHPASFGSTISVAATDWGDAQASFSNHGKCVDILAPGRNIRVADHTGGNRVATGTSVSAPYVAGAAAIYLAQNPGASPEAIRSHLISSSTKDALHGLDGSPNRLLYVAPKQQLAKPAGDAVCQGQDFYSSVSGVESGSCSEEPSQGGGASGSIGAYIEATADEPCFGPITAGPGTDNAKQAFSSPVAEGGCGMAWNDQLGHKCHWLDEPDAGWQCFGSVPNGSEQPQSPQTTPKPPVDSPGTQSSGGHYDEVGRSNVDRGQQHPEQPQTSEDNDAQETTTVTQDEVDTVEVAVDESASPDDGSVCRGQVIPDIDLDQARRNFAQPMDQGGCGTAWDDQNLGHQCEWVSGSPQGWQCFGEIR